MSLTTSARALIVVAALCSALPVSATTTTTTLANQPPVANAGSDRQGTVNTAVSFDASASSDPDGTIIAYWWTWGDGSTTSASTAVTAHVYATAGTYSAVLWVQDDKGAWSLTYDIAVATIATSAQTTTTTTTTSTTTTTKATTTTTLASTTSTTTTPATTTTTTTAANQPPVANAGPDQTGAVKVAVSFDASLSHDNDGTITTYWWSWGDGSSTSSTTAITSHVYATTGTFSAVLWVQDNKGAWSLTSDIAVATIGTTTTTTVATTTTTTKTTTTTIGSTTTTTTLANRPPVANAGPDQAAQTLTTLTFDGSGSYDPDGSIAAYAWNFGDGATAATAVATHAYATYGTYTVTLTVADNKGATASDTAVATIADRPPTANAGPDQSAPPGMSITFNGSGSSDPDGTITSYAWAFGDGATATGMTVSHAYATAGSYTATLTVTDNAGQRGTDSAAVAVSNSTWATAIGGTDYDGAYAVATDGAGNVAVVGQFRSSMRLGTTTLTSAGLADGFIAKYTSAGALVWARSVGGAGDDSLEGIAFDPLTGDVVVTGRFAGTASFGGTSFTASGASDIVVARYAAATGAHVWSKAFGGAYDDSGDAVAVDPSGNVLVTGYFKGSINFGGTTLSVPFGTDLDVFVAKFTSAGAHVWSKNFTNTGNDRGYAIATDATGNVAVAGWFSNAINFGGSQLFASNGLADAFVAKFTSAGAHVWSRQIGSTTGEEQAYGVAFDAASDVIVCGYAINAVDFGGGLLASLGNADGFVASYAAANGAHQWSRRVGGTGDDYAHAVTVDANGNVLLSGSFQQTGSFGGTSLVSAGVTDAFVAKYTNGGSPLWARDLGGTSNDVATSVAMSGTYPVAAGYFSGAGTFGLQTLSSSGLVDAFLVRLAP